MVAGRTRSCLPDEVWRILPCASPARSSDYCQGGGDGSETVGGSVLLRAASICRVRTHGVSSGRAARVLPAASLGLEAADIIMARSDGADGRSASSTGLCSGSFGVVGYSTAVRPATIADICLLLAERGTGTSPAKPTDDSFATWIALTTWTGWCPAAGGGSRPAATGVVSNSSSPRSDADEPGEAPWPLLGEGDSAPGRVWRCPRLGRPARVAPLQPWPMPIRSRRAGMSGLLSWQDGWTADGLTKWRQERRAALVWETERGVNSLGSTAARFTGEGVHPDVAPRLPGGWHPGCTVP